MTDHGTTHSAHDAHDTHSDTVTLPLLGTVTLPGGMYTAVFGFLGVLTITEVLIAELLRVDSGSDLYNIVTSVRIGLLIGIGVFKALLVAWFYMHLKSDNRIFLAILLLPTFITLLSLLYLIGVPPQAGLGYN